MRGIIYYKVRSENYHYNYPSIYKMPFNSFHMAIAIMLYWENDKDNLIRKVVKITVDKDD